MVRCNERTTFDRCTDITGAGCNPHRSVWKMSELNQYGRCMLKAKACRWQHPTTPDLGRGSFRIKPCRAPSVCCGSGFYQRERNAQDEPSSIHRPDR